MGPYSVSLIHPFKESPITGHSYKKKITKVHMIWYHACISPCWSAPVGLPQLLQLHRCALHKESQGNTSEAQARFNKHRITNNVMDGTWAWTWNAQPISPFRYLVADSMTRSKPSKRGLHAQGRQIIAVSHQTGFAQQPMW